ncbi:MAG TPA: hypothetical protein VH253_19455 [Phycisphaerae bacterium]|nr:hypothetical protein [Phycisphaerae bacterium]
MDVAKKAAAVAIAHPELFDTKLAASHQAELTALAVGDNDLLAVAACRLLCGSAFPPDDVIKKAMAGRHYLIQAAEFQQILRSCPEKRRAGVTAIVESLIPANSDSRSAEGLLTAMVFSAGHTATGDAMANEIAQLITRETAQFRGDADSKEAVADLLALFHRFSRQPTTTEKRG